MGLAENIAAAGIDAVYAVHGKCASYTPAGGGDPVPCTVLFDIRDSGAKPEDGRPIAGQAWIEVRAKEIAQPAYGDSFTIGTASYSVASRPQPADADGYGWKMWVE